MNPYPKILVDEVSGCEVKNDAYYIWEEGYKAGTNEVEAKIEEASLRKQPITDKIFNKQDLDKAVEEAKKPIIEAYDEYIQLLVDELNEVIGLSLAHGWKSSRYEAGVKCREKIEALKSPDKGE